LHCPDHQELASFYVRLLEGTLLWTHEKAAAVEAAGLVLVMQRIENYEPPAWPGTSIVHLDMHGGTNIDQLAQRAIALGAQLAPTLPDPRWRVLLDPAGHPFCITPFTP
jgi:hypothetical protein